MPIKEDQYTIRQERFIEFYANPESETFGNATRSYMKAGYKNGPTIMQQACKLVNQGKIKKAIREYRGNVKEKQAVTRDYCVNKLQSFVDSDKENTSDRIRAIAVIGDFCGFNRDNAPNPEREAQIKALIDKEARILAEEMANKRLSELSKRQLGLGQEPINVDFEPIRREKEHEETV